MSVELPATVDHRQLDESGKTVFDTIYQHDNPSHFYATMQALDYRIPMEACPWFRRLLNDWRRANHAPRPQALRLLDLGSSYGVNAALLKWGFSLPDLYQHYADQKDADTATMLAHDQAVFSAEHCTDDLTITGLDISANALHYAEAAGLLDQSVCANLEVEDATAQQAAMIAANDCVISSGCIGYMTTISLEKILQLCAPQRPWMAHCILRLFDTRPYEKLLEKYGYRVWLEPALLPQRRFASDEEQTQMLEGLQAAGIDPAGYESEGWLYAQVLMAVPEVPA